MRIIDFGKGFFFYNDSNFFPLPFDDLLLAKEYSYSFMFIQDHNAISESDARCRVGIAIIADDAAYCKPRYPTKRCRTAPAP